MPSGERGRSPLLVPTRAPLFFAVRLLACLLGSCAGSEASSSNGELSDWVAAQGATFFRTSYSPSTVTLEWIPTPQISVDGFVVTVTSRYCCPRGNSGCLNTETGGYNDCNFPVPTELELPATNFSYTVAPILGGQEFDITVKAFRWEAATGGTKQLSAFIQKEYVAQVCPPPAPPGHPFPRARSTLSPRATPSPP